MTLKNKFLSICILLSLIVATGCKEEAKPGTVAEEKKPVKIPLFNADSTFAYLEKQLSFGPRNPGSEGHVTCKDWMVSKFKSLGADVIAQDFTANIYTGDSYPAWNIIAQYNPKHKKRVILSAHWDTRFIGEEDSDPDMRKKPIPGADDGGTGTAVLIEIARILNENPIDLGVDLILWDAEDQGQRGVANDRLWCLGSQYWSRNKHKKNYKAQYGINLDMVGAKNPRFGKELNSQKYARATVDKLWSLAQNMGYGDMFVNDPTGPMTDDHLFVCQIAKIPMLDVINSPVGNKNAFIKEWHTHDDDISKIDKRSLRVVGQVVTAAIYKESTGHF